jgi:hypothetical protein
VLRKRGLLPAGLLLFLSAGLLASAPGGFSGKTQDQAQPERPKFYALRVVSEKNVLNAKDSLGAPDGRYAEIPPGGQLILLMEQEFYAFPGNQPDSGIIVCKGEKDYALEGWFRIQDTKEERQNYAWMIISRNSNRFVFLLGSGGVNMIRITNTGTKSLFVDAVIGYGIEAERR